jgi:hypothetical protein
MKLLVLEALVSAVYIFDVSTYPFIHVPFYMLTLLYFGSILEMYGLVRISRFVMRRLSRLDDRRASTRASVGRMIPSFMQLF